MTEQVRAKPGPTSIAEPRIASVSTPFIFPRVIDATMRSDWKTCPHKFFQTHVHGLARARPNIHLHFGGAVARGLEVARRAWATGTADTNTEALTLGCEALIEAWGTAFDDFVPVTRTEGNKTLSNALLALQAYFHEWPLDDDEVTIHTHNGEPCVEFSFALPIPSSRHPDTGEPVLYAGRFDFIGDYQRSIYGVDDKTASVDPSSETWRQQWKLRGQFSGYCWAAREYGMNMHGFLVRGLGVMKESIRVGQVLVARPPWMVDAWLRQLQDDVQQMCSQYRNFIHSKLPRAHTPDSDLIHAHPFPQAFDSACADFGGCTFLDLCSSPTPEAWLGEYIERRWNPLTREEV